jgi:hypothetical protein
MTIPAASGKVGTYALADLLEARFLQYTVAKFGEDTIALILQRDLEAHNRIMLDLMSELATPTTDLNRLSGSSIGGEMQEVDEFGAAATQKTLPGTAVGFPLRKFQHNVGWTSHYMKKATVNDFAIAALAAEKAHVRAVAREIRRAVYGPTDYTWTDIWGKQIPVAVKAFINADGAPVPDGPNGEAFDPTTHTHYSGSATLTAQSVIDLIDNVVEHNPSSSIRVNAARADETAIRALSGFYPYIDSQLVQPITGFQTITPLDISRLDNRAIGKFAGAEVWIKPWALANYLFAYEAASDLKPLAFREDETQQGLYVAAELPDYPLYAKVMEAMFGVGVWNRANGAVLEFDNASYQAPVIT